MGLSASTYSLEGVQPSKPNSNSTMFRFVALFALVAVAAAEPESDSDAFMQYHHGDEAHMKTVTGDTASVAAAKEDHFQMKAAEYAKKGYAAPYAYGSFPYQTYGYPYHHQQQYVDKTPMVNAAVYKTPVVTPAVYNNAAVRPVVYKNQVAQQQFVYKTPSVYTPATYAHSVVPASTYAMPTYTQGTYSAYPYHHLGKRDAEAEAESDAWYYNTNAYAAYPQYNRFYNGVYGARAGVYNAYPTNVYGAGVYGAYPYTQYGAGVYGAYPYTQYSQFQQRF